MSISLTVLLVLAAVILLAFGIGSTGGAIRFLGGGGALLVAIAATAAAILLFWVGHRANWTSDGPGMLFVMIAIVVCAIVAAVSWMLVFSIAATAAVTRLVTIGSGARSIDARGEYVAVGFESGEVALITRAGAKVETLRLTAKSAKR